MSQNFQKENNRGSMGDLLSLYSTPSLPYENYQNELRKVSGENVLKYLTEIRGLKRSTLDHFKIGATDNNEVAIPIFKNSKLIDYKFRDIRQKGFRRFPDSETWVLNDDAFFLASEKGYIIITEGEFDCMAVWQMGFRPVVSGTGGAMDKAEWIASIDETIEKVYINYDNDEPGQEAAKKLAERIGIEKCYNIVLPTKDANDFIREGHTAEEYGELLKSSKRFEIKGIYKVADVLEDLRKNPIRRVPVFSKRMNEQTNGGIPRQALVVLSGRTGIGKSTALMNFLVYHANQGKPTMLISLENDIYMVVQKFLEVKYGRKLKDFTEKDWEKVKSELVDYPFYIDMSMDRYNMEEISRAVKQAKKLWGLEALGFDHIGFLPNRGNNATNNLSQMVRDFKILCREADIITYLVSHVRKADPNNPVVTREDLKGTSSLAQDSDMVLLLYNNKDGMHLTIDKSRNSRSYVDLPITFNAEIGVMADDMSRRITSFGEPIDDIKLDEIKETKTIFDSGWADEIE